MANGDQSGDTEFADFSASPFEDVSLTFRPETSGSTIGSTGSGVTQTPSGDFDFSGLSLSGGFGDSSSDLSFSALQNQPVFNPAFSRQSPQLAASIDTSFDPVSGKLVPRQKAPPVVQDPTFFSKLFGAFHDPKSPVVGSTGNLVFKLLETVASPFGIDLGEDDSEEALEALFAGDSDTLTEGEARKRFLDFKKLQFTSNRESLNRQLTMQFALTLLGTWYADRQQKRQRSEQRRFYARQLGDTQLLAEQQFERQLQLSELSASTSLELARVQNERFNRGGGAVSRAAFTDFTGSSGVSK